jgi:hypothetical protein
VLGDPNYGALGSVIKIDPEHKGRIQLSVSVPIEPDFRQIFSEQALTHEKYEAGARILSPHILFPCNSRVGSVSIGGPVWRWGDGAGQQRGPGPRLTVCRFSLYLGNLGDSR